jgi:hypothetical protein
MTRSKGPQELACLECPRLFANNAGLSNHRRTHERERRLARCQQQQIAARQEAARQQAGPSQGFSDTDNDSFDDNPFDGTYASQESRASPGPFSEAVKGEQVRIHPLVNGS